LRSKSIGTGFQDRKKMPKKLNGQNSKAVTAKARKDEKAAAEKERVEREKEDAMWRDDDKKREKKLSRKEDTEKKRLVALERKKERKEIEEEEAVAIGGSRGKPDGSSLTSQKMTRKQIEESMMEGKKIREITQKNRSADEARGIEENVNRLQIDGEEARTIETAVNILSGTGTVALDKHPEKRIKAAYEEFEKSRLPALKVENPNLRLSQLKQLLRKEWMKSPQNPFNNISR